MNAEDDTDNAAGEDDYVLQFSELNAGLLAASKLGKRALLEKLLSAGANVNTSDSRKWTALHYASFYGHHTIVDLLLQHGAADDYSRPAEGLMSAESSASPKHAHGGHHSAGATHTHIVNSPLHHAVSRLHIRCVWALLHAGFSPLDVDQYGNNSLHLACASSVPARPLQCEVLRTLMSAGHDAGARNWLGQTALDLLPQDAVESRKLVQASMSQTQCAVTGTPFGGANLRYLCSASGTFLCEDATVPMAVKAWAPRIAGTTVAEDSQPPALGSIAEPLPYATGVGGLPVAACAGDEDSLRPVRYAAQVAYKVQDAESALEAAMEPFTHTVAEAYSKWRVACTEDRAARVVTARADYEAAWHAEQEAKAKAKAEEEERKRVEAEAAAKAAEEAAAAKKGKKGGKGKAPPSPRPVSAGAALAVEEEPKPEPEPEQMPEFVPPTYPPIPTHPPVPELDLYFSAVHAHAVESGLTAVREVGGNPHTQAKALGVMRRLEAAGGLREACKRLAAARPLPHLRDTAYVSAQSALEHARVAGGGVGPTLLSQATLALQVAAAEVELHGAVVVASGISIGTHLYDAILLRLSEAVSGARAACTAANLMAHPPDKGIEHFSLRAVLGVPTGNDILAAPIKEEAISEASTLLSRLQCEVQVTDSVVHARAQGEAARVALEQYREHDPTELPVPELPPVAPEAADAAAAAAAARPPSTSGKRPASAKKEPAPAEAAPPAPPSPDFPLDQAGVPLPDTPQLLALKSLRDSCKELDGIITASRTAGADAACTDAAVAALTELRAALDAGLLDEAERVTRLRAEKAKAAKKGKKKGK